MKKQVLYSSAFLLLLFISLTSCTMDKRLYRPGYNVQWNASKSKINKNEAATAAVRPSAGQSISEDAAEPTTGLAPEALPDDPALKMPVTAKAGHKKSASVDDEINRSTEEEKAVADAVEGQADQNQYAATARAKKLAQSPEDETKGFSSSKQARVGFANGFKRGFNLVQLYDELMDEPRLMPLALAALICGIVSIVAYYGAFVLGVLAIVFGAVAMYKIRQNPGVYRGRGMALAGFILGIISLAVITTIIIFY